MTKKRQKLYDRLNGVLVALLNDGATIDFSIGKTKTIERDGGDVCFAPVAVATVKIYDEPYMVPALSVAGDFIE